MCRAVSTSSVSGAGPAEAGAVLMLAPVIPGVLGTPFSESVRVPADIEGGAKLVFLCQVEEC